MNVDISTVQQRERNLFSVYLERRKDFRELKESKEVAKLLKLLGEESSIPDAIAKAVASMDREELIILNKQVEAYEAFAKHNHEINWQVTCRRELIRYVWVHKEKRRIIACNNAEMSDCKQFLSPGSLADQQAKKQKLLAKIAWAKDYQEKTGQPLPKRWGRGKGRSNKSCRGGAGLEHL